MSNTYSQDQEDIPFEMDRVPSRCSDVRSSRLSRASTTFRCSVDSSNRSGQVNTKYQIMYWKYEEISNKTFGS